MIIEKLEKLIEEELKPVDVGRIYDDMLDECYSFKSVGGPFSYMSPSRVLREVDPTAYRCGMADYTDGLELIEVSGNNYDPAEAQSIKESLIEELQSKLGELEAELSEEEEQEEGDDIAALKESISEIEKQIEELEDHSF